MSRIHNPFHTRLRATIFIIFAILIAALVTWLACFWIIIQRRRQRLQGVSFARASLLVAIPALIALYLSLPSAR